MADNEEWVNVLDNNAMVNQQVLLALFEQIKSGAISVDWVTFEDYSPGLQEVKMMIRYNTQ